MTCIVGLCDRGDVVMGADSAGARRLTNGLNRECTRMHANRGFPIRVYSRPFAVLEIEL